MRKSFKVDLRQGADSFWSVMRSRSFLRSAIFAASALACTAASVHASPWAEVGDNQLRSDIELLAAAGVTDNITTHWPLPWQSLKAELQNADLARQPAGVQAAARRVLAKAQSA